MLGGAAVHFSLAASFFTEVRPVGPVGDDFGSEQFELLESRGVTCEDIERVAGGQSFFWRGHYDFDLNVAHTDDTQLGVFGEFEPKLSEAAQAADTLFLANIQPDLQRQVRAQCDAAGFSGLDSMNLWIEIAKDSLLGGDRRGRLPGRKRRRDPHADRRVEPFPGRPRGDGDGAARGRRQARRVRRRPVHPGRATATASSPCPASRSRTSATRPAPATALRAASSATSTAPTATSTRPTCGGRWATAPCSPPSTSRSSAPSGSPASIAARSTSASRRCGG